LSLPYEYSAEHHGKRTDDALFKADFVMIRQSGSHVRFQHKIDHTRQTTVPLHSGDIPRWLVREILRQTRISVPDFLNLLKEEN